MRTMTPRAIQPIMFPSSPKFDRFDLQLDFERFGGKKEEG